MKAEVKVWKGIEMMSHKKMERRRELAKLPFEKKISILKLLQHSKSDYLNIQKKTSHRLALML